MFSISSTNASQFSFSSTQPRSLSEVTPIGVLSTKHQIYSVYADGFVSNYPLRRIASLTKFACPVTSIGSCGVVKTTEPELPGRGSGLFGVMGRTSIDSNTFSGSRRTSPASRKPRIFSVYWFPGTPYGMLRRVLFRDVCHVLLHPALDLLSVCRLQWMDIPYSYI